MQRAILSLLLLAAWPATAWAQNCCMPNLGEDEQSARLIEGVQWATLVLLAVPCLLIGAATVWIRRWRADL